MGFGIAIAIGVADDEHAELRLGVERREGAAEDDVVVVLAGLVLRTVEVHVAWSRGGVGARGGESERGSGSEGAGEMTGPCHAVGECNAMEDGGCGAAYR